MGFTATAAVRNFFGFLCSSISSDRILCRCFSGSLLRQIGREFSIRISRLAGTFDARNFQDVFLSLFEELRLQVEEQSSNVYIYKYIYIYSLCFCCVTREPVVFTC